MFKKLTNEAIMKLRPLLVKKLPATTMVLNITDMMLRGKYSSDYHDISMYSYGGVPETENIFIDVIWRTKTKLPKSLEEKTRRCNIRLEPPLSVVYSPTFPTDEMLQAFTDLYDWNEMHGFENIMTPFDSYLEKIINEKGGTVERTPCAVLMMTPDEGFKLNLGDTNLCDKFELDRLDPHHAPKINEFWKFGFIGGELCIAETIKRMGGIGVFLKQKSNSGIQRVRKERDDDDLVCWVTRLPFGTIGVLFTMEEYRKYGLAKWCLKAATKWVAEDGLVPLVEVEPWNTASRKLVEEIGYKLIHDIYFMHYTPPVSSM